MREGEKQMTEKPYCVFTLRMANNLVNFSALVLILKILSTKFSYLKIVRNCGKLLKGSDEIENCAQSKNDRDSQRTI